MKLFNDAFASNEYFPDLAYGIKGVDYEIIDDQIVRIKNEDDKLPRLFLSTIETYQQPANSDRDGLAFLNGIPESMVFSTNSLLDLIPVSFGIGFNTSRMPPTQFGNNYNSARVNDLFTRDNHLMIGNGLISQEEAIAEYKSQFMKEQINEYIDNLNERIGAKTTFSYELNE
ncbi:MAG: hypothetical protein JXQ23_00915 [Clostridia bacterium]|nr:hypothetical protein [Clostridia bacterium]